MPAWALDCYSRLLPRLEAERQMAALNMLLASSGRHLPDHEQRALVTALERQAHGDLSDARPKAPPVTRSQLERIGFQMADS